MKKKNVFLTTALVLTVLLTGCGKDKAEGSSSPTNKNKDINYINADATNKKGIIFLSGGEFLMSGNYALAIDTEVDVVSDFNWLSLGNNNFSIVDYDKGNSGSDDISISFKKGSDYEYIFASYETFDEDDELRNATVIYENDDTIVTKSSTDYYQVFFIFDGMKTSTSLNAVRLGVSSLDNDEDVIAYAKKWEKRINIYTIDEDGEYEEVFNADDSNEDLDKYYYANDLIIRALTDANIYIANPKVIKEANSNQIDISIEKEDGKYSYYIEEETSMFTNDDFETFKVGKLEISMYKASDGHFIYYYPLGDNFVKVGQFTVDKKATTKDAIEIFKKDLM
jgi:hypothetical protein